MAGFFLSVLVMCNRRSSSDQVLLSALRVFRRPPLQRHALVQTSPKARRASRQNNEGWLM